jgi:hypothetical protein
METQITSGLIEFDKYKKDPDLPIYILPPDIFYSLRQDNLRFTPSESNSCSHPYCKDTEPLWIKAAKHDSITTRKVQLYRGSSENQSEGNLPTILYQARLYSGLYITRSLNGDYKGIVTTPVAVAQISNSGPHIFEPYLYDTKHKYTDTDIGFVYQVRLLKIQDQAFYENLIEEYDIQL